MEERIDLTEDALRKRIREHEERYVGFNHKPTHEDVESILHAVTGLGLIAELKRCYELIDILQIEVDNAYNAGYANN